MATRGVLGEATIKEFEESLSGELFQPGDGGYDEARAVWNGAHDAKPALVARCADAFDVRAAIGFARSEGLEVAVRGGGHSIPGFSSSEGGLVIDLSPMKGIRIDAARRIGIAEGGVLWNEFDAACQAHGLATTGGLVSTTGVAGFTLGGGIGWLMRKHGLACDNLRAAELVTADGQFVRASETENSDLLWALRGGGGNFGVVTTLEYDLHPVGPEVAAGAVFYPGDRAEEILHAYRDLVGEVSDEFTTLANLITAPPAPFIPEEWHGKRLIALIGCYVGDVEEGLRAWAPFRELGDPVADLVGPMPYVQMQSLIDALWPKGTQAYMKAGYLRELDDHMIDTAVHFHQETTSPSSEIHIQHLGGEIARVPADSAAYNERQAPFVLNVIAVTHGDDGLADHVDWAQRLYSASGPSLTGGAYINFLSSEGDDRVRAAYGDKFPRLQAVKDEYDPTNLFHLNQNVPPSGRS